jgi:hypothetical protein
MVLLLHWSLLNYAAVVKILKKHDKRSGLLLRAPYLANVLQQVRVLVGICCFACGTYTRAFPVTHVLLQRCQMDMHICQMRTAVDIL